ncbi:MAG: site-specific DNA-methyltransferase [Anoxybacillus sp.]|nr:site-specific DNA-methyltransferase [Anoxybacillus sp.]MCL6586931.1 site-specific DNA-methyltransferase [Anoxybacillus sp.]
MLNSILLGDSIEKIKDIADNSIHAIISDIPYGISYDDWDVLHNNTNSALGGQSEAQVKAGKVFKRRGKPLNGWSEADKKIPYEYQEWCSKWASEWLRVLKPGSSCFIFAGRRYAHRCIVALEDAGFTFKDMLAWEKNSAPHRAQRLSAIYQRRGDNLNYEKWSGWKVGNLRPLFEPILWFQKPYKTGGTIADNVLKHGVGAWNEQALEKYNTLDSGIEISSNIIKVATDKFDSGLHEAQKPLRLMQFLIELVTMEGQIVLDPFAGSGTTCVAAKLLNRNFIGIEAKKEYVDIANERLKNPKFALKCEQISFRVTD